MRILRNAGIGLAGLIVVVVLAALVIVQTDWFRNYVKEQIIAATEAGTGGRVEVGSFSFSPRRLEAIVTDFVIHGKEPAGSAPFVRAARVQLNLRLFTSLRRFLDVTFLGVERPEVNVITFADGTTNIPAPKDKKPQSDTTILDTVVDLAVDAFRISNGLLTYNSQTQKIDLRGNNLKAQLFFNVLTQTYKGELSLQPVYVVSGKNTPVVFTVTLPIIIQRTGVSFENAKITTPNSDLTINGSLADLNNPKTVARINGSLALSDLKNLGDLPLDLKARAVPSVATVDGNVEIGDNRIDVKGFRVNLGDSNIEASGTLKDPEGKGALEFKTRLALDPLGKLAKVTAKPAGVVVANGTIKLDAENNPQISGNIQGRDLSFLQGTQRIRNVNLSSALNLDAHNLDLQGVKLSALGGTFTGNASLKDFENLNLSGNLRNLNLGTAAQALGQKALPYDGVVSGPIQARGNVKTPGGKGITASAKLNITPGRKGVPVSGRIVAEYNGKTDNVSVTDSYIALPNTRLDLSGSLNNRLNLDFRTKNLNDLLAAAPADTKIPVALEGGAARFTGSLTGGASSPHVVGHLDVGRFSVEGRRFDSLQADVDAAKNRASLSNAVLARGPMQARFAASAGLQNWSPKPNQPLTATVSVQNGDLADVMVLAGQPPAGYSGALTLEANVNGTIGNPTGIANLQVLNGKVKDEPFDRIQAKVNLADQLVTIPSATINAGPAQVTLSADYRHPRESFTTGQLHARVESNQVNLQQVRAIQRQRPNTAGILNLNADVTGTLSGKKVNGKDQSEFLLTSVNGNVSAKDLRLDGQTYGEVNAKATTSGKTVSYNVTSDFAGSDIKVVGATQLIPDYPTKADANLRNLPVERILTLVKQTGIPARGRLSGTAHFDGTVANPEGTVDLDLANAVVYKEPLDHVRAKVSYLAKRVDVPLFEVVSGDSRINLNARYDHEAGNLSAGDLQFRVNSNRLELAKLRNVQSLRPGLAGALQIAASGAAAVREGTPQILLRDLNADIGATGISAQGKNFGDLTLKAATNAGTLNFALDSNLAQSAIQGRGTARLTEGYPLNAELNFKNVIWSELQPLIAPPSGQAPSFDAITDGKVTVSGPATDIEKLNGSLQVARLQLNTVPGPGSNNKRLVIRNEGPIPATLAGGTIRIASAHMVGPETDASATGTISLKDPQAMDLNLNAKTNLSVLESVSSEIYSSGNVALAGTVRGTLSKPLVNGKLDLQNASFNYAEIPNGLSNANGSVIFSGNTATIRAITAESGGGKVTLSGFVTYGGNLRLGLRASANGVRVRTQQGVSIVASSSLTLTGTQGSSLASGTITIDKITYAPQSDIGSILTRSAPPVQAPGTPNPLLDNMRLDVRVRTSASTAVQASLAQNLQLDADLRVRGTAARPGVLGRVLISEGDLVFFGSKYRVSSGTISFYNPVRIEPVLNISLETQAKGVNVVLTVTGPVDNMKLSYTSDPPLQFQEIVGLLASGRTPTSDPTLLANQPSVPQQSFQQMGESAIVSKAVADPVASRLERVFGVSQLKIDPTFTSGSELPQAKVTLQQQIASNLTFTYVTALQDPNTQIIRVEWALSPQWSAVANRDENGIFSVNFLFKKQFR